MNKFMQSMSQDSLIRLMQQLLRIQQLTPAQSTLADYVIAESNLKIEVK
jgi:hypothetical protein